MDTYERKDRERKNHVRRESCAGTREERAQYLKGILMERLAHVSKELEAEPNLRRRALLAERESWMKARIAQQEAQVVASQQEAQENSRDGSE